ncbi:MAG TPA: ABC transporter permease [Bryobacteraceae bacterium]|jgi:predicted permease|nr:ABC transporter permease [Bryobacteraceae bacterium]
MAIDYLFQSIRLAFRRLRRSPGFTIVAILTLALGIGANTTTFTAINAILFRPLAAGHPDQLIALNKGIHPSYPTHSYPNYRDLRDRNITLSGLMAYGFGPASLSRGGSNNRVWGHFATGNYFDVLELRAMLGRTFHAADDGEPGSNPVVVLSYGCWQQHFAGDPQAIGKTAKINGLDFTILGVMPTTFTGTEQWFAPEFWVPYSMEQQITGETSRTARTNNYLFAIGRLKPGVTSGRAEAELDSIAIELGREYPADDGGMRIRVSPPGLGGSYFRGPVIGFTAVLAALAGLVLLIACVNLASLVLARAADRRKETAICLALGAGRHQLAGQLLVENLAVSLSGGAVGMVLAAWLAKIFTAWRPPIGFTPNTALTLDAHVFWFAAVVSCLSSLLFGLAPALQSVRTELVPALKNEPATRRFRRLPTRDLLVAAQISLSVVLLVSCLLVVRSLQQALTVPLGFNPRAAVQSSLDLQLEGYSADRGRDFERHLLDRLSGLPQFESVALTSRLPLGVERSDTYIFIEGQPVLKPSERPVGLPFTVTPGYFHAMQTRLLAGRDFDRRDRETSMPVAIVNRKFAAALLPGENPLGKRFRTFSPTGPLYQIVGVVETGKYDSLNEEDRPAYFRPLEQSYSSRFVIVARTAAPPGVALDALRRTVLDFDPGLTIYDAVTLTEHLGLALFPARLAAVFLAAFGLLAITLAATGVYGVMAYAVSRRKREIGIRVAIGASPANVIGSIMGRTAVLLGGGTVGGAAVALAISRYFAPLLYNVNPRDPAAFATAIGVIAAITVLACLVPARRAVRVDAMVALRED